LEGRQIDCPLILCTRSEENEWKSVTQEETEEKNKEVKRKIPNGSDGVQTFLKCGILCIPYWS
jgi:hypothetical protein